MKSSVTRREVLARGASGMVFLFSGKLAFGSQVAEAAKQRLKNSSAGRALQELPRFDGVFIVNAELLAPFADDFGHYVHKRPLGVLKPANASDIQKMAKHCRSRGLPLTMRGTGGAAYGQTQIDEGIVIDSSSLADMNWISGELVGLGPGAIWKDVLDFTIQKNRTPMVLPDTLVTSVGGKTSVGGIGETSYNLGAIVDHVVEFDLVLPDGTLQTCNSTKNKDLFEVALGGMGQVGFLTRVVLRTMPAPAQVESRQFKYESGNFTFLADVQMIANEMKSGAIAGHLVRNALNKFDYILDVTSWGQPVDAWLKQIQGTQVGSVKTWSFFDYANRNTKGWQDAVVSGSVKLPHAYMAFFLPFDKAREMADFVLANEAANLGAKRIMISPLRNEAFGRPFFCLPKGPLTAHFRIYRIADHGEGGPDHLRMLESNKNEIVPKVFALGGTVYLPFSPLLTPDQRLQQFGEEKWRALSMLEAKYDPKSLINLGAGLK